MEYTMRYLFLLTTLLFSSTTFAEDSEPTIQYKAKTEIDFEGLEVAGELIKPSGSSINVRRSAPFNPLIKLRTDFNEEMNQSVNEIK